MPAVCVSQKFDQLVDGCIIQVRSCGNIGCGISTFDSTDTINSPSIATAGQVQVLLDDIPETVGMFDDLPVHVGNIQTAIGPIDKLYRTKPGISGGDEFT